MDLSVVVPTLNGRDRLATSLDSLAAHAPDVEVVVVNGPSADGTTGMVRDRDDVDVLVELSARTLNVARNAGIQAASGDVVAFLGHDFAVEPDWADAIRDRLADKPVVTGPTRRRVYGGQTADELEHRRICKRDVSYFDGGNVAFRAPALDALDGFDEYLETGGARDAAHRLAGLGYDVVWEPTMQVSLEHETDGGVESRDWEWKYRALAYRLVKNYGLRPEVARRTLRHAGSDAYTTAKDVVAGRSVPTSWFGTSRAVVVGMTTGARDGLVARARDRSPRRNPRGVSTRTDRAVAQYDSRSSST
ncbi:glycosyltransferase family 2 protein [Salinigranum salinum]|uniref:glycosyltransferase family 2 protein n=1 Tax=Salinigranum salinum TaxID=1364937 RepID=UPI00126120C1|nr:glycosyltransferase family A protein [Salinigranum salinum]